MTLIRDTFFCIAQMNYNSCGIPENYATSLHPKAALIRLQFSVGYYTWPQLQEVYGLDHKTLDHILNGWYRGWLGFMDQGQGI